MTAQGSPHADKGNKRRLCSFLPHFYLPLARPRAISVAIRPSFRGSSRSHRNSDHERAHSPRCSYAAEGGIEATSSLVELEGKPLWNWYFLRPLGLSLRAFTSHARPTIRNVAITYQLRSSSYQAKP